MKEIEYKPEDVKILSITAAAASVIHEEWGHTSEWGVFGLGDDGRVYTWERGVNKWELH